jgi:putative ABC transport system permease protein
VVVVSHGLWQRRLGGAGDVLDRTLVLNGRPHTIVGVMPPDFRYPTGGVELWVPLAFTEAERSERKALSVRVLARLLPGKTLDHAREELAALASDLAGTHPRTNAGRTFWAVRLREQQAGLTGPFAALLQTAALLVLGIACANVSGLLLARGLARRREMGLRAALGASRGRVVRQLLTESLVLSLLGGVFALVVASAGVRLLSTGVPSDITKWVAGWDAIRLDERALLFALVAALLTALFAGLLPALGAARPGLVAVLGEGGRGIAGGRGRARSLMVVTQMALALVLLVSAALMVRGFGRLLDRYEAHAPGSLLTFRVRLPDRYAPGRPVADFYLRLLPELTGAPGVDSVAAVSQLPGDLGPTPGGAVSLLGRSAPGDLDLPTADHQSISPDYFRTLRVRVFEGRAFGAGDGREAPPVAIVSASLARRLWPEGRALGQRVKTGRPDDPSPWREVVGVVDDVTQYWFDREPRSVLYLPLEQAPRPAMFLLARTRAEPAAVTPSLRARVRSLDSELPLDEVRTLRRVVDDGMAFLRLAADLLLLLGGVAIALSALGVYGIVAQDVAARTQEIGVRLALGADPEGVGRFVLLGALRLAGLSLAVGVPAAFGVSRLMGTALFGVARPEVSLLGLFGLGLLGVALLSAYGPARRAAALDPVSALRRE